MSQVSPSKAEAILFDLDGTLIDTAPDFIAVLNRQLQAHGRTPLPPERVRASVSQGAKAVVALGFGDRVNTDSQEFEALRQEFLQSYLKHIADETMLFPGMDTLLTALEARGTPWGIVTNKHSTAACAATGCALQSHHLPRHGDAYQTTSGAHAEGSNPVARSTGSLCLCGRSPS